MIAINIIGIMLTILGIFPLLLGVFTNNVTSEEYAQYIEQAPDNTGWVLIVIGSVLIVIGLALAIYSNMKKPADTYSSLVGLILTIFSGCLSVICFIICTFKITLVFYVIAVLSAYLMLTGIIINIVCAIKNKV